MNCMRKAWLAIAVFVIGFYGMKGFAAEASPLLMLNDFERPQNVTNAGQSSGTWNADEKNSLNKIEASLVSIEREGKKGQAMRLSYKLDLSRATQVGYWMKLAALDARPYDHLELWVRGVAGSGFAPSFKVEFKQTSNDSKQESLSGSYVLTGITDQWQKFSIPLNTMNGIQNWNPVNEFVINLQSRRLKSKEGSYEIDDIALVTTGKRGPSAWDPVVPPKKKQWEEAQGGEAASKPALQRRLMGWPSIALADRNMLPPDDRQFIMRVARDTWKGIDALTDREHGLPLDTVRFSKGSVALNDSQIGDYTNVTNIGVYLLCMTAAVDLKFLTSDQARLRLRRTLTSLEKMESFQGFLYNYYDTTTLERTSNFISFVDSAWLTAGLIVIRNAFPEFKEICTKLIDRGNYAFFYDDVEQMMWHGYYVNLAYPSEYHYGAFFTEPRIGSLIAIGKGDVPEEHWYKMMRTFPESYAWQTMKPIGRISKTLRGNEVMGGWYEWKGIRYVPSWGGSLFEALMPTLVLNERQYAPYSLGLNDERHVDIQRDYALQELKYPVWGMSPCATAPEDGYSEYGVKILGSKGYKSGVVTPHVTGLAMAIHPKECIDNLRKLIELYDIYGEYGFYDSVQISSGKVATKYLALDQGMLFLGIANFLSGGYVQQFFSQDPIIQKLLPMLREELFFE